VVYRRLIEEFDNDELNALVYEMTGTTDTLFTGADNLSERVIALTSWAARHGQLDALLKAIQEKRGT
jgi:hypothetical protein